MTTQGIEKDDIAAAIELAAARLCAILASSTRPDVPAIGTWSVRDVAAHLVTAIELYTGVVRGNGSPYTRLDRIAEFNALALAAIDDHDCAVLAGRIKSATAQFVEAVRSISGDPDVSGHAGIAMPVSSAASVLLGEVLVHGDDIARASGRRWAIPATHASLVFRGALTLLPHFLDQTAASRVRAVFHVRLRGQDGPRATLTFKDGILLVASRAGAPVDCHLLADPVSFLLLMYERRGTVRTALTGGVVAWGRRPWLAVQLPRFFRPF